MAATWIGSPFEVYPPPSEVDWSDEPGLYLFVQAGTRGGLDVVLYVGETDSLRTRLPTHERWQEARSLGATQVHVRVIQNDLERYFLEANLIEAFQPPLNVQHR